MSATYSEKIIRACLLALAALAALAAAPLARSHGSVSPEDDLCLIRIDYLSAHFKIYLPTEDGHRDYCEDLPRTGQALFVMEYIHQELGRLPVEFRVIRNVTGLGRFTNAGDLATIEDLDAVTVLHRPAAVEADVYTVMHRFEEAGDYLGIVRIAHPGTGREYLAVFPFEVGYSGPGAWLPFLALALLGQLSWWLFNHRRGLWYHRPWKPA